MVKHVVTNSPPASDPPVTWSSAVREDRALSAPGVSLQLAATQLGFGPHSKALSLGARLFSRHCRHRLPASLPNLTQLQH